jgi:hypothetical protein
VAQFGLLLLVHLPTASGTTRLGGAPNKHEPNQVFVSPLPSTRYSLGAFHLTACWMREFLPPSCLTTWPSAFLPRCIFAPPQLLNRPSKSQHSRHHLRAASWNVDSTPRAAGSCCCIWWTAAKQQVATLPWRTIPPGSATPMRSHRVADVLRACRTKSGGGSNGRAMDRCVGRCGTPRWRLIGRVCFV